MEEALEQRLAAKKRDLENKQEYFKIDIKNIEQSNYEDNAINALLYMKKLKTEIAELELLLQFKSVYEDETCVLSKDESDTFNAYLEGDIKIAFGNTDWNHIYRKIVGNNSSEFAEKYMEDGFEI
nr:MAG TPA: hypothetical protein [Caudoviricetes sp.]